MEKENKTTTKQPIEEEKKRGPKTPPSPQYYEQKRTLDIKETNIISLKKMDSKVFNYLLIFAMRSARE